MLQQFWNGRGSGTGCFRPFRPGIAVRLAASKSLVENLPQDSSDAIIATRFL